MPTHSLRIQRLALSVLFCGQAAFSQTGVFHTKTGNRSIFSAAGQFTSRGDGAEPAKLPQFRMVQQSSSTSGLSIAGSFAQIASAGGWDTILTLVNLGTAQSSAGLSFYSNDGSAWPLPFTFPQQPAGGATLAPTLNESLTANATLLVDTTGPLTQTSDTAGSAQLLSGGGIDGFAIFKYTPTNQQAVVPLETRNAPSYILPFDNTGQLLTGLAIASLGSATGSVHVVVRDDAGVPISTAVSSIALDANGHNSFMLTDTGPGFPEVKGKRGTVEFDTPAGGRIAVLGLRVNSGAITTLPALANVATGGGVFAQVAAGGGWQSTITLVNASTSSTTVTLNYFKEDGTPLSLPLSFPQTNTTATEATVTKPLAAGASLIVATASPATANAVTGSAQLVTSGKVSGFAIFRYLPSGQEAAVPLETRTPSSYVLAFDNTGGVVTGVAIANPTSQAVNVPVTVRDDAGAPLTTASINLPANGHKQFMLTDDPGGYPQTAGKRGTVEFGVPSGGRIATLGIRAQGKVITSVPALAKVSIDGNAISQRELAQTGLAIGQASNVLQSQVEVILNGDGSDFSCQTLTGGGSIQTGTTPTYSYQGQSIYPVTLYYDTNCTRPYIVADVTGGGNTGANTSVVTETATYYGVDGTVIGTMLLNMALALQGTTVQANGLGTFTAASGSQAPVNLGLFCSVGSAVTLHCAGAIEQDFAALGIAIGTVTPLTLTQSSSGGITFSGTGSSFTGPIGSLTLTNPTPSTFVVQGGTTYSSISVSGSAATFSLFPPTPTGWTLTDATHDVKLQISVVDETSRTLSMTITQVSTSKTLATGTLDQSGTGKITYSDGSSAAITNWTLEN